MPNLYELAVEFEELQQALEAGADGDSLDAFLDKLDESKTELRVKVDNICKLLSNMGGDIDAFKKEEQRLATRRKAKENGRGRLRDWLRSTMDLFEVTEITTDVHKVQIQAGQPTVVVTQPHAVPEAFMRVKREPNKKAIMAAFKEEGLVVEGCDIVPGKSKLVIR